MPFGMMAVVPGDSRDRCLDPANRIGDRPAAEAFRNLREGTGPWYARGGARLPYATLRGCRCDWLVDVDDGTGRLLSERLGRGLEGLAVVGDGLANLAGSLDGIPWTPWVEERYPGVDERRYRELAAFIRTCAEHGLALSFARG